MVNARIRIREHGQFFVDIRNKPVKNMLKKEGCLISREGHLTVKKL